MSFRSALRGSLAVVAVAALCTVTLAAQNKIRIIQTNSAGDNVHLIDPATNKIVGVIEGIGVNHGATASPDGSRIYDAYPGGLRAEAQPHCVASIDQTGVIPAFAGFVARD